MVLSIAIVGDIAAALATCEEAIAVAPTDSTLYANRSALLLKLGKVDGALADAEKVLSLRPEWSRGYQRKGLVLLHLNQAAEAVLWLERGAALDPTDAALQRAVVQARARRDGLNVSFTLVCGQNAVNQLGSESLIDIKMGGQSVLARFKAFEGRGVTSLCGSKKQFMCLLSNGEVYEWGFFFGLQIDEPRLITGLKGKRVVQIAAGTTHQLFLCSNGVVYARGSFEAGQLGLLTKQTVTEPEPIGALSTASKVTNIAAGYYHSMALTESGEVYEWGTIRSLPTRCLPTRMEQVSGHVTYISAGAFASAAVTGDGRVWTWGDNSRHALGHAGETVLVPTPVAGLAGLPVWRVALGKHISAAVTSAGQLFIWGSNQAYPRPHLHPTIRKIAVEAQFPATPTLVSTKLVPAEIDNIVVGKAFLAVLSSHGTLHTFGHNGFGQLGIGRSTLRSYTEAFEGWQQVLCPFRISAVAASHYNLLASAVATYGAYAAALLRVFEMDLFTDCTFVVAGRTLPVHRAIIWARCPVLYDKYLANAPTGAVINLESKNGSAFFEMLRYVYGDRTEVDKSLKAEVLPLAKTWGLGRLSAACSNQSPLPASSLAADLSRLLSAGMHADVGLCGAEAKEPIKAHKFLLATRSEYFRAMFAGSMKERAAERVDLPDVSHDILKNVLAYLYTERAILDAATAVDQLVVANTFGLEELKQACELEIGQHLDADNVFLLYQLAETHECPQLSRRCLRFVEVHAHEPALRQHKDWIDMPKTYKSRLQPIMERGTKKP